ncbi:MAG: hypothetical protein ACT4QG_07375 [Sporichthyaceae bacterium]
MSITAVRALAAALGAAALLQLPPAGAAEAGPVRTDVVAPLVVGWEAEVVRDRLKLLPSKAEVIAGVRDATAVAGVKVRFVRGTLVHGGEAVHTNGTSWRAEFPMPAADSTGLYEVWIDTRDTLGNSADTRVGTLHFD